MINLEPIEAISYDQLVDLLAPYLGKIDPDLMIIGNRLKLNQADHPFLLVLNRKEKRIGIIEILDPSKEFPSQILAHAFWVSQNSYAIANLNKSEFNPDLPPFVIGLTLSYPDWQNLISYLKLDVRLFKYQVMTLQGSPVLIFDPLFRPVAPGTIKEALPTPPTRSVEDKFHQPPSEKTGEEQAPSGPLPFHYEGFYEAGLTSLTEEEIRYFSN